MLPSVPPPKAAEQGPVTPPVLLRQVAPTYPARARAAHFEPTQAHRVRVRVFVDETGRPQKVTVVEGVAGPYGFDDAARDAALKSSFFPAKEGGRPVAGSLEISFLFPPTAR